MTYTTVIIVLPLGSLVAQRFVFSQTPSYDPSGRRRLTDPSASPSKRSRTSLKLKRGFLPSWSRHSDSDTTAVDTTYTATSSIVGGQQSAVDPYDMELRRIDEVDLEAGGSVRVETHIERREQRVQAIL